MIDWKSPRTGAVRFLSRGMGLGFGCFKIFRIVFRECSNSRAIRLMGIPSRSALRMAPFCRP